MRTTLPKNSLGSWLLADDRGGALVDYALVMALFSLAMIAGLRLLSGQLGTNLNRTGNNFTGMSSHS